LEQEYEQNSAQREPPRKDTPIFSVQTSRGFPDWLQQNNVSFAVTTYQVGKLFFFGLKPNRDLWIFNRTVGRCLGLAISNESLWISADAHVHKFRNALHGGQRSTDGHDAFYAPRVSYYTGDLDVHDMAVTEDGSLIFVNTLFNCLSALSMDYSFVPIWRPPFISELISEDRCHLNGLALRDGKPAFVTAIAASDTYDGWRSQRATGGVVMDVETDEIVSEGLSMPHSPRFHNGQLWLLNSGTGEFGAIDLATGRFNPACFIPGYLRGLAFVGNFAIVGLSKPRDNAFMGLALSDTLIERKIEPRCGLYIINLITGAITESLTLGGVIGEIYDVCAIPGNIYPSAVGPHSPEARRFFSIGS
jgi:uncharacterized protein (TIGR03032 family)